MSAYIGISGNSSTTITVYLGGLDTRYNGTTRRVRWEAWYNDVYLDDYVETTIPNGISESSNVTLRGLQPDTRYYIVCRISNITGSPDIVEERTANTSKDVGYPPDRPSWIDIDDESTDHQFLVVDWEMVYDADEYDVYVDGKYFQSVHLRYSVIPASPDTSYYVCVYACNAYGRSPGRCGTFRTKPAPDTVRPKIWGLTATTIKSSGNYNIRVNWSSSDDVGISHHWAYRSPPNTQSYTSIGYNLPGSARSYTFTTDANGNPFKAGDTYYFEIRVIDTSDNLSIQADGRISLKIEYDKPSEWDWSYNIYSGGEFYDYSSDGKTVYLMPAFEWNDFTSRINEFRAYKGLSQYSFTTATRNTSGAGMRTCINEAINAINTMLSTGRMSTVYSNDVVSARIFLDLRDKLNLIL